jgi:hypothetical protein
MGDTSRMSASASSIASGAVLPPDAAALKAANVNPKTGLATDYLNLFNEYIMLAEMVGEGSMEPDILADWQPRDYESHFVHTNFAGVKMVLAAYRALPEEARDEFEEAVNGLIDLILAHQHHVRIAPAKLDDIREQRDKVAALIGGPAPGSDIDNDHTQAAIDALFD